MRGRDFAELLAVLLVVALACSDARPSERSNIDSCFDCHGDSANENNAPPPAFWREPQIVDVHQLHLASSDWHAQVVCTECHLVPEKILSPGHLDTDLPAEITWGPLATAQSTAPEYDGTSCENVYCHGTTLAGRAPPTFDWAGIDSPLDCGSCHGAPPASPHAALTAPHCGPCHDFQGIAPIDAGTHINGVLEAETCGSNNCHGIAPDQGAHLAHYGDQSVVPMATYGDLSLVADYYPDGAPYYQFGCGNCHPIDTGKHGDGTLQVELYDAAAPMSSIKSLHPETASFDGTLCQNVYCHSTGQENPTYVDTPSWIGGSLAGDDCSACHANPPNYPSGGGGTATANTHLVMGDDGWEFGHFGGLPGPWHGTYHGATNNAAAPITCQTCHAQTVDPARTAPGGYYYLDTSGNYNLGGNLGFDCISCHTGTPPAQTGRVLTAKHVNGARDVDLDKRQEIPPSVTGLPAGADRPTYTYWVTAVPGQLPVSSTVNGGTWSFHLANSAYEPNTKTCWSVPCHLRQSAGSTPPYDPLTWGLAPVGGATCNNCHQF